MLIPADKRLLVQTSGNKQILCAQKVHVIF